MKPVLRAVAGFRQIPGRISAVEGYRLWAGTYDTDPNPLLALELRTLTEKLDHIEGKAVFDVGCGTGRWMIRMAAKGADTIGIDLSHEMLLVAGCKAPLAGRLIQAEGCLLPLRDQCADIVICSFLLGYVSHPEVCVRELGRIARRGGRVLVSDLHPEACRMGWRRSFREGSSVFEIEDFGYTVERLLDAGRSADLDLQDTCEPCFGEPERQIMRDAGKEQRIQEVSAVPAMLAIEWRRR